MKFAFLGPESTGKTTTALEVTKTLNGVIVPEISREFLADKGLDYSYDDILEIAKLQFAKEIEISDANPDKIIICDTELISMEVWLDFYGYEVPNWIPTFIYQSNYEKYFLFDIDIPWISDGLRNNEKDREELFTLFKRKLNFYNKNWELVQGQGEERTLSVLQFIKEVQSNFLEV
jgi:nicotinamide riboside kinase